MSTRYPGLESPNRTFSPEPTEESEKTETTQEMAARLAPARERPRGSRATSVLLNANAVCMMAEEGEEAFNARCDELLRLCKSEPDAAERARNVAMIELASKIRAGEIDEYKLRTSGTLSVDIGAGIVRLRDENGRVASLKNTKLDLTAPAFERPKEQHLDVLFEGNADEAPETDEEISLPFPGENEPDPPRNPFRPSA